MIFRLRRKNSRTNERIRLARVHLIRYSLKFVSNKRSFSVFGFLYRSLSTKRRDSKIHLYRNLPKRRKRNERGIRRKERSAIIRK